jgi:hypothetical protein
VWKKHPNGYVKLMYMTFDLVCVAELATLALLQPLCPSKSYHVFLLFSSSPLNAVGSFEQEEMGKDRKMTPFHN